MGSDSTELLKPNDEELREHFVAELGEVNKESLALSTRSERFKTLESFT